MLLSVKMNCRFLVFLTAIGCLCTTVAAMHAKGQPIEIIGHSETWSTSYLDGSDGESLSISYYYTIKEDGSGKIYNLVFDGDKPPQGFRLWNRIYVQGLLFKNTEALYTAFDLRTEIYSPSRPLIYVSSAKYFDKSHIREGGISTLARRRNEFHLDSSITPPGKYVWPISRSSALVLVNFLDGTTTLSQGTWQGMMWTDTFTVDKLFRASSFDTVRWTDNRNTVFGPYTINANTADTCDTSLWMDLADAKMTAAGVDYSIYDHVVYSIPADTTKCGFAGRANVGCVINGNRCVVTMKSIIANVLFHELGHNFGLNHANQVSTGNWAYKDYSCGMGISSYSSWGNRQFNVPHTHFLGWINDEHVRDAASVVVDAGNWHTVTINALELDAPVYPFAYRWPSAYDSLWYYMSYRAPLKEDVNIKANYLDVLNIHGMDEDAYTTFYTGLADSETWVGRTNDSANGFFVQMLSHTATTATARLKGCFRSQRVVLTQSSVCSDTTVQMNARIYNDDSPACPSSRTFGAVAAESDSCIVTDSVTPVSKSISKGSYGDFVIDITPKTWTSCKSKNIFIDVQGATSPTSLACDREGAPFVFQIPDSTDICAALPTPSPVYDPNSQNQNAEDPPGPDNTGLWVGLSLVAVAVPAGIFVVKKKGWDKNIKAGAGRVRDKMRIRRTGGGGGSFVSKTKFTPAANAYPISTKTLPGKSQPLVGPGKAVPAPSASTASTATALWNFKAENSDEIDMEKGQKIEVLAMDFEPGWARVRIRGMVGIVPSNRLTMDEPVPVLSKPVVQYPPQEPTVVAPVLSFAKQPKAPVPTLPAARQPKAPVPTLPAARQPKASAVVSNEPISPFEAPNVTTTNTVSDLRARFVGAVPNKPLPPPTRR